MNPHQRIHGRSLPAQGEGTRTEFQTLMPEEMAVIIAIGIMLRFIVSWVTPDCREISGRSVWQQHWLHHKFARDPLTRPLCLFALPRCIAMPRLRGTPRRGAAWYAAKSQRKRKETIEKAMAVAARRRRMRGMAIVEEEIPGDEQDSPPVFTLFTAPEHRNPRSQFGQDNTTAEASGRRNHGDSGKEEPYSPCYVEEEPPPEPTRADTGDKRYEATADTSPAQPPSAAGDYLSLIFDVRHLLDDQVFRIGRLEQRIDLFFAAHSRATPKKQCPTCARPYAFPARWRHTEAADIHMDSKVT
jgi:hypothetical protein